MSKRGDTTSFWVSYGDLMTSLFFVMLVLSVILIAYSNELRQEVHSAEARMQATEAQVRKVKELEAATKGLDSRYFEYDDHFKKFVLKIPVQFRVGSSDITDIPLSQQRELLEAGRALHRFIQEKEGIDFLMIIEGQSSRDSYRYNRELSYARALCLYNYWKANGLDFESAPGFEGSEALVVGSGIHGKPRHDNEAKNQRFLITLINKPGVIQ